MLDEEIKRFIRANYDKMTAKEIGAEIGRTPDRVRQIARRMGFYKQAARQPRGSKCQSCMLSAYGFCVYRLEAEAWKCKYYRFTTAEWPKKEVYGHY